MNCYVSCSTDIRSRRDEYLSRQPCYCHIYTLEEFIGVKKRQMNQAYEKDAAVVSRCRNLILSEDSLKPSWPPCWQIFYRIVVYSCRQTGRNSSVLEAQRMNAVYIDGNMKWNKCDEVDESNKCLGLFRIPYVDHIYTWIELQPNSSSFKSLKTGLIEVSSSQTTNHSLDKFSFVRQPALHICPLLIKWKGYPDHEKHLAPLESTHCESEQIDSTYCFHRYFLSHYKHSWSFHTWTSAHGEDSKPLDSSTCKRKWKVIEDSLRAILAELFM